MAAWRPQDVNDLAVARSCGKGLWSISGTLIALGNGRQLARISGIEEVILERPLYKEPPSQNAVTRLTSSTSEQSQALRTITHSVSLIVRSSLFYTKLCAPHERMREFRYRPTTPVRRVDPVLVPASRVLISRDDVGRMVLSRHRNGSEATITIEDAPERRDGKLITGWTFVGKRLTKQGSVAGVAVVERYDYQVGKRGGNWRWTRVGKCPAWYGQGQCAMFLNGRKLREWEPMDKNVKKWMTDEGRRKGLHVREVEKPTEAQEAPRRRFLGIF